MNSKIESLFQAIGNEVHQLGPSNGRVLAYAEVEDGVISAQLFYVLGGRLIYKVASPDLEERIYSLWEEWQKVPGNREWRAMSYVIDGGKFTVDFVYPDQFDERADEVSRRTRVANTVLGDLPIDYSQA